MRTRPGPGAVSDAEPAPGEQLGMGLGLPGSARGPWVGGVRPEQILGLALVCAAGAVIAGWVLRLPGLVQLQPGNVAMVFNTACCFALSGLALALPTARCLARGLRRALGAVMLVLATAVLAQHLFAVPLGVDWPGLHDWLNDGNPMPGRMAWNTAAGFQLAGLVLVFMRKDSGPRREALLLSAALLMLFLGGLGLAGHWLELPTLYGWWDGTHMALPTAAGMMTLGLGLWLQILNETQVCAFDVAREGRRVMALAAGVLTVITLTVSLTGFALLEKELRRSLHHNLNAQLDGQAELLQESVARLDRRARELATAAPLADALRRGRDPQTRSDIEALRAVTANLVEAGLGAVRVTDAQGQALTQAGQAVGASPGPDAKLVAKPDVVALPLHLPGARLLWTGDGFILHHRLPLRGAGNFATAAAGHLTVEQALPSFSAGFRRLQALGRTTSVRLCAAAATGRHCVPPAAGQRLSGAGAAKQGSSQGAELAPMDRALRGEAGMSQWPDDRRRVVFAAYRPVTGLGLGLVVTQDAAELYNPISAQFLRLLPAIGLLVLVGVWLLNLSIKPLVRRLVGTHRELQAKSALQHAILDSADYAVIAADRRGVVCAYNRAAERMLGYPADAVVGRRTLAEWHDPAELRQHAADVTHPGDAPPAGAEILAYRPRQGEAEEREWTFVRADGERLPVWLNVTPLRDATGELSGLLAIADDISERKRVEEHLRLLATTDVLTGLANRSLFYDRLSQAMARAHRSGDAMALLYLDIDRFKQVNDSLGHSVGDALLRAFAIRLRDTLRQSDTVARLGGDEFTVLIEGLAEPRTAAHTATKILSAVRRPFDLDGTALHVSVSIGIALYAGDGLSAEALLKHADQALYAAKGAGRDGFQAYADPPLTGGRPA